jgi:UDP-4-amino-4,6-dideoxy-N-acetyl-beta-L-altrosamine transaminase
MLPYGRQCLDEEDVNAVIEVLRSSWLTTGPAVEKFEQTFANAVGVPEAVAVSSGTAALHAAMYAIGIGPGDEVIVPAVTFAATANCVVYQRGVPVFVDVDETTLLINPKHVEELITPQTKAVIAVDYAGHPCDYDVLRAITDRHGITLVADACHSLGGTYKGRQVGTLADLNVFSFHPVKHITTGEGGIVATAHPHLARRMKMFRNHGITTDHCQRLQDSAWFYEMVDLGYNYRITDFQCAMGCSQLQKLTGWVARRQEIARLYDAAFAGLRVVCPLGHRVDVTHAYHLYVVRLVLRRLMTSRAESYKALHAEGIGVNVHYIPVYLHPFYRERFGTKPGLCPVAEAAYEEILSLPIFPAMTDSDVDDVIKAFHKVSAAFERSEQMGCDKPGAR